MLGVLALETIFGMDLGVFLALAMFAVFMLVILSGYNVAFSFACTAIAFAFLGDFLDVFDPNTLNTLPGRWYKSISDPTLLAVPLFVLMGAILERSGMAERLLNAFGMLMGRLRGVVAATVIVMGLLSLPAMVRLGYDNKLSTGAIIASGTLAQLLPPSIVLILLARQLGVGILGLFAGALLPGLLLSGLYVAYVLILSWLKPDVGPAMPKEQRTLVGNPSLRTKLVIALILGLMVGAVMLLASPRASLIAGGLTFAATLAILWPTRMLAAEVMIAIVPMLVLILGVLVSIFQGIATPSESGAVGVFGALLLTGMNWLFDRLLIKEGATHITRSGWRLAWQAVKDAAHSTSNVVVLVMTLLFCSTFFSLMFFQLGGSDQTSEWLTAVGGGKWGFVLIAMIAVFLLGINLEFLEITFIVVPIFVPAMDLLGFTSDEKIWFAVLMAANLNMAFISPPVGFSLFYLSNAGRSTSTTARSPSDHNGPPQPPHGGLAARQRTCTRNGPPPSSPTLSTSTSPSPTNSSHMRVGSDSTGILQSFGGLLNADSGGSLAFNRGPSRSSLHPQTRRALKPGSPGVHQGRARCRRIRGRVGNPGGVWGRRRCRAHNDGRSRTGCCIRNHDDCCCAQRHRGHHGAGPGDRVGDGHQLADRTRDAVRLRAVLRSEGE